MAIGFPPNPVFPLAIDSDRTLYKVYNTTESRLALDNAAWSSEIEIVPVGATVDEIWPDNGFCNLEGEIIYYDSVEKNNNGKVFKLKRCARALGDSATKFNPKNTWIRGFVMAEHHNQLVNAINLIENAALDEYQLLDLAIQEDNIIDDRDCAIVDFKIRYTENFLRGVTVDYEISIEGNYTQYNLNFGDGNSTDTLVGTYTYSPNTIIDPIVTVTNNNCQIVITPTARQESTEEPTPEGEPTFFEVPVCEIPDFPTFTIPDLNISTDFVAPPIVLPCFDIPNIEFPSIYINISIPEINIQIPSIIVIEPEINIPSIILFTPEINIPSIIIFSPELNIPSIIIFSPELNIPSIITFDNMPQIPSIIEFINPVMPSVISIISPTIPTEIIVIDSIPTEILVLDTIPTQIEITGGGSIPEQIELLGADNLPSEITITGISAIAMECCSTISIDWGDPPSIDINWGEIPAIGVTVTVDCPSSAPAMYATNYMDDSFQDSFSLKADVEPVNLGIPSEIKIISPTLPNVKLVHELPTKIDLNVPEIPDIKVIVPENPFPKQITFENIPKIPEAIKIDASDIPMAIRIESNLPEAIDINVPKDFPTSITLDASEIPEFIQVKGIPNSIEIKHNIPDEIYLKVPENLEIPLVYKGGPVPLQLNMQSTSEELNENCFALVPCGRK